MKKNVLHPGNAKSLTALSVASVAILALMIASSAQAKSVSSPIPASGDVLIAGGVSADGNATSSAEYYSVSARKFVATGAMATPRATSQAQVLLPTEESGSNTGDIYVIGGFSGSAVSIGSTITFNINVLDDFELYDPKIGNFSPPVDPVLDVMSNGRAFFPSIDVPIDAAHIHGHFIVIDGICNGTDLDACRSSDVIHPDDHVTSTSNPIVGRMMHTATLLQDETTILVTGGFADLAGTVLNSAEVLDTNTDDFTAIASMNAARAGQTATILKDGTVLIAGGYDATGSALNSAEIFDPIAQTFATVAATMHDKRAWHTATMLSDGTVLLAGGFNGSTAIALTGSTNGVTGTWTGTGSVLDTAEIYDPTLQSFTCVHGIVKKTGACRKSMKAARMDQTASVLGDGSVLIAGGFGKGKKHAGLAPLNSAEVFQAGKFKKTGNMTQARAWHSSTTLP